MNFFAKQMAEWILRGAGEQTNGAVHLGEQVGVVEACLEEILTRYHTSYHTYSFTRHITKEPNLCGTRKRTNDAVHLGEHASAVGSGLFMVPNQTQQYMCGSDTTYDVHQPENQTRDGVTVRDEGRRGTNTNLMRGCVAIRDEECAHAHPHTLHAHNPEDQARNGVVARDEGRCDTTTLTSGARDGVIALDDGLSSQIKQPTQQSQTQHCLIADVRIRPWVPYNSEDQARNCVVARDEEQCGTPQTEVTCNGAIPPLGRRRLRNRSRVSVSPTQPPSKKFQASALAHDKMEDDDVTDELVLENKTSKLSSIFVANNVDWSLKLAAHDAAWQALQALPCPKPMPATYHSQQSLKPKNRLSLTRLTTGDARRSKIRKTLRQWGWLASRHSRAVTPSQHLVATLARLKGRTVGMSRRQRRTFWQEARVGRPPPEKVMPRQPYHKRCRTTSGDVRNLTKYIIDCKPQKRNAWSATGTCNAPRDSKAVRAKMIERLRIRAVSVREAKPTALVPTVGCDSESDARERELQRDVESISLVPTVGCDTESSEEDTGSGTGRDGEPQLRRERQDALTHAERTNYVDAQTRARMRSLQLNEGPSPDSHQQAKRLGSAYQQSRYKSAVNSRPLQNPLGILTRRWGDEVDEVVYVPSVPTVGADFCDTSSVYSSSEQGAKRAAPPWEFLMNDFVILVTSILDCLPAQDRKDFETSISQCCVGEPNTYQTIEELLVQAGVEGGISPLSHLNKPRTPEDISKFWSSVNSLRKELSKMHLTDKKLRGIIVLNALGYVLRVYYGIILNKEHIHLKDVKTAIPSDVSATVPSGVELGPFRHLGSLRNTMGHRLELYGGPHTTRVFVEKYTVTREHSRVLCADLLLPSSTIRKLESFTRQLFRGPFHNEKPYEWGIWVNGIRIEDFDLNSTIQWEDLLGKVIFVKAQPLIRLEALIPGGAPVACQGFDFDTKPIPIVNWYKHVPQWSDYVNYNFESDATANPFMAGPEASHSEASSSLNTGSGSVSTQVADAYTKIALYNNIKAMRGLWKTTDINDDSMDLLWQIDFYDQCRSDDFTNQSATPITPAIVEARSRLACTPEQINLKAWAIKGVNYARREAEVALSKTDMNGNRLSHAGEKVLRTIREVPIETHNPGYICLGPIMRKQLSEGTNTGVTELLDSLRLTHLANEHLYDKLNKESSHELSLSIEGKEALKVLSKRVGSQHDLYLDALSNSMLHEPLLNTKASESNEGGSEVARLIDGLQLALAEARECEAFLRRPALPLFPDLDTTNLNKRHREDTSMFDDNLRLPMWTEAPTPHTLGNAAPPPQYNAGLNIIPPLTSLSIEAPHQEFLTRYRNIASGNCGRGEGSGKGEGFGGRGKGEGFGKGAGFGGRGKGRSGLPLTNPAASAPNDWPSPITWEYIESWSRWPTIRSDEQWTQFFTLEGKPKSTAFILKDIIINNRKNKHGIGHLMKHDSLKVALTACMQPSEGLNWVKYVEAVKNGSDGCSYKVVCNSTEAVLAFATSLTRTRRGDRVTLITSPVTMTCVAPTAIKSQENELKPGQPLTHSDVWFSCGKSVANSPHFSILSEVPSSLVRGVTQPAITPAAAPSPAAPIVANATVATAPAKSSTPPNVSGSKQEGGLNVAPGAKKHRIQGILKGAGASKEDVASASCNTPCTEPETDPMELAGSNDYSDINAAADSDALEGIMDTPEDTPIGDPANTNCVALPPRDGPPSLHNPSVRNNCFPRAIVMIQQSSTEVSTDEVTEFLAKHSFGHMVGKRFDHAAQQELIGQMCICVAWVRPMEKQIVRIHDYTKGENRCYYVLKLTKSNHCEPVSDSRNKSKPMKPCNTSELKLLAQHYGYTIVDGTTPTVGANHPIEEVDHTETTNLDWHTRNRIRASIQEARGPLESLEVRATRADLTHSTKGWTTLPPSILIAMEEFKAAGDTPLARATLEKLLSTTTYVISAFQGERNLLEEAHQDVTHRIGLAVARAQVSTPDDLAEETSEEMDLMEALQNGLATMLKDTESPLASLRQFSQSLSEELERGLNTQRSKIAPGGVGSPSNIPRVLFESEEKKSELGTTERVENSKANYSAFDPDKKQLPGVYRPEMGSRKESVIISRDPTSSDAPLSDVGIILASVQELSKTNKDSFALLHTKISELASRVDSLEVPATDHRPSKQVTFTPRTYPALNLGLSSPSHSVTVDVNGRYVRPLVGAALTPHTHGGMRPPHLPQVELGSGIDTPGRPGAQVPGKATLQPLSTIQQALVDRKNGIPTSGLKLAYLLVVSHTVLVTEGEHIQLDQHLIGDQWLPLCTGRTCSPALGQALMQFGIRTDDQPFDPTIVQRDALTQRARNLFYIPVVTAITDTCLTVPEFSRLSVDTIHASRDLITISVSHHEKWPKDWVVMSPPDYFVLVRMHAGFDRSMYGSLAQIYNMTALRQQLSLVRHTFADILQQFGVNVSAITASLPGRRVLSYLDANYRASETEEVPLNLLVQASAQPPSLYDTDAYSGRAVRLPEGRHAYDREDRDSQHGSTHTHQRIPELKSALCIQIARIEPANLKSWSKGSIQWWHLRFLHAFTHGVMKCMIDMLLAHGAVNAYDALKTLIVDRIGERFSHFLDLFTYPNFVMLLSDTIAAQAISLQEVVSSTDTTSVQGQQRRADQFVQGLCRILLVIRSIPYSATIDEMARSEMKRLQSLKRPDGLSDPQWWTDVARRFRSWLTLEGRETMAQAGSEIRDFLHAMLIQVTDRHMRNEIIRLSNTWVSGLPAHFGKQSLYALLQYDIAPPTRAPMYPIVEGVQSPAPALAVFEKSQDLRQIHDMGEVLRKQGYSTSGPELTHLLLDYTVKYVGEQGAAAAIANTQGDTQVLLVRAEAVGPENALEVIVLVNDVLYSTEAWPDMRSCIPDVYPTPRASHARAETKPKPSQVLPRDDTLQSGISPVCLTANVSSSTSSPTPVKAWEEDTKRLEHMINTSNTHLTTQLAHFGDLIRTQLQTVAPPSLRHAPPLANAFSTSRTLLTDADHDSDKNRKNLGGGRANIGKVKRTEQNGMKYMDKPAILYSEIDENGKTHLASALDISSEADWIAKSNVICPICPEKNHYLNRCLSIWCCTGKGRKFFGADKAALRFRRALVDRRPNNITLMDIFATYDSACSDCDPDGSEGIIDGLDMLVDTSKTLSLICDGTIDNYDPIFAVHEFDHARITFLQLCSRVSKE